MIFESLVALCAGVMTCGESSAASLSSFSATERERFEKQEQSLVAAVSVESLRKTHELLASEPHVAGTEGDAREIDRIAASFKDAGLEVQVHEIWPLLASPVSASLDILSPDVVSLDIRERPIKEDRDSAASAGFGWNAYSASGDVSGEVVYANYGTKEDFAKLKELGIQCAGRIVMARYGGNFRGYKAKFAEAAGAAGLIIYTDPADSGYMKGLVYPEGGFANDCCTQRGSILTLDYQGDPLTPGREATRDAQRLREDEVSLPRIPVQPIGYGPAKEIMSRMTGAGVPEGWQGGMPFSYRLTGGSDLRIRLKVEQRREVKRTASVIGSIRGAEFPEQMVILGAHHDAWNHGASDPLCGTITVCEAARVLGDAARHGYRPRRTIMFAAWAAEEFGLLGSTEWVEGNRARLMADGVAYINLDMASMGMDFGASASPSMRGVIRDAAMAVPAGGERTVLDDWLSHHPDTSAPGWPVIGNIGGGSDHVAFLCFAGVPCAGMSGSGSKGWSYHSAYDTLTWYWKVVGSDYAPARMVTQMAMVTGLRLADAPVVPLDPGAYGPAIMKRVAEMEPGAKAAGLPLGEICANAGLAGACDRLSELTAACARVAERAASGGLTGVQRTNADAAIRACERAWLDEAGLPGRAWFKNQFVATDENSGYASWTLPGLCGAVEHRDRAELEAAVAKLVSRCDAVVKAWRFTAE